MLVHFTTNPVLHQCQYKQRLWLHFLLHSLLLFVLDFTFFVSVCVGLRNTSSWRGICRQTMGWIWKKKQSHNVEDTIKDECLSTATSFFNISLVTMATCVVTAMTSREPVVSLCLLDALMDSCWRFQTALHKKKLTLTRTLFVIPRPSISMWWLFHMMPIKEKKKLYYFNGDKGNPVLFW